MTTTQAADWDLVAGVVREHGDALKAMQTHTDLFQFAKDNKLDTKSLFPKFKTELRKQHGMEYDELRARTLATREAELASAAADAPLITLCCAGDVEVDSYAVCNIEGGDPWYGTFHENDRVSDQDSADFEAARKAVYLARQAREFAGLDAVRLHLLVSNHRVTPAELLRNSLPHNVLVTVEVIDDAEGNPALERCRDNGFRGWREVSLTDLLADTAEAGDDE